MKLSEHTYEFLPSLQKFKKLPVNPKKIGNTLFTDLFTKKFVFKIFHFVVTGYFILKRHHAACFFRNQSSSHLNGSRWTYSYSYICFKEKIYFRTLYSMMFVLIFPLQIF